MNALEMLLADDLAGEVMAGGVPPDLVTRGLGAAGSWAQTTGRALVEQAVKYEGDGVISLMEVIADGGGFSSASITGLVSAAIGRITKNLQSAPEETRRNWTAARVMYLSTQAGVRFVSYLPRVRCDTAGGFRFVRAGVAKDRCVPYFDPLGFTTGAAGVAGKWDASAEQCVPEWLVPYNFPLGPDDADAGLWSGGFAKDHALASYKPGIGYSLPDSCVKWTLILADVGSQNCSTEWPYAPEGSGFGIAGSPRLTICWPWAWPLTCPVRITGRWQKESDASAEKMAAGLYLLPTPQHLQARMVDVMESERLLRRAMAVYHPSAVEVSPGQWRLRRTTLPDWNGYAPQLRRPDFVHVASALARVHAFKRCRAAIVGNLQSLPEELLPYLGSDFKGGSTRGDCPQAPHVEGGPPLVSYAVAGEE